jgi:hypothetical protein
MSDETSVNGAATRAADLRARRADGRKPATSARIITAGISGTAILGMMAAMGAAADSNGAPPTTVLSVESTPPVEPTTVIESPPVGSPAETTEPPADTTVSRETSAIVPIPAPTPVPPTQPPAPTRPLAITRQSG